MQINIISKINKLFIILSALLAFGCMKEEGNPKKPEPKSFDYGSVTDIEGNVYKTIKIGNQEWMAENLRATKYRNGNPILNITADTAWQSATYGAYCNYDNDTYPASIYGKLYNFYTVSDVRNICPLGWHIPTIAEWNELFTYVVNNSDDGYASALMEENNWHWYKPSIIGTNDYGFTALPGGFRSNFGYFLDVRKASYWWASDHIPNNYSCYVVYFTIDNEQPQEEAASFNNGYSIRCVKD